MTSADMGADRAEVKTYSPELQELLGKLATLTNEQMWQVRAGPRSGAEPDPVSVAIKAEALSKLSTEEWWIFHRAIWQPTAEDNYAV
jgi:hypothetical protein